MLSVLLDFSTGASVAQWRRALLKKTCLKTKMTIR